MIGQNSSAPPRPACWRRRRDTWSTLHWVCHVVTCHVSSGNGGLHGYVGDHGGGDGCGEMTNRRKDPHSFSSLTLMWREILSVFVFIVTWPPPVFQIWFKETLINSDLFTVLTLELLLTSDNIAFFQAHSSFRCSLLFFSTSKYSPPRGRLPGGESR